MPEYQGATSANEDLERVASELDELKRTNAANRDSSNALLTEVIELRRRLELVREYAEFNRRHASMEALRGDIAWTLSFIASGECKSLRPAAATTHPQPGDRVRVTWRNDGKYLTSGRFVEETVDSSGGYIGRPDVHNGDATVEVIKTASINKTTDTIRPPRPGVDYCGAQHSEHGVCFLDVDQDEHEHGHESETGRWPVNDVGASRDA